MGFSSLAELDDVGFRYFDCTQNLFENLSLCIDVGNKILIHGESGCGKSTLLALLSKIIPKFYQGHVTGSIRLSYSQSAIVLQNPEAQIITPTVFEEIAFALENGGYNESLIEKKVNTVLSECGIFHLRNRTTRVLSGGEAQMVSLACAIAQEPDILFLDEPSAYLDPKTAAGFFSLLHSQPKTHTWVIVEHRIDEIHHMITKEIKLSSSTIHYVEAPKTLRHLQLMNIKSTNTASVRCTGLTHFYTKERLFLPLECTAKPGSILCITGDSGSGKTTILKKIAGILPTEKGQLWIDGHDAAGLSAKNLAAYMIYVPQNPEHFFISQTVAGEWNIADKKGERARAVKEIFQLSDTIDSLHPALLSEGEKRRLSLALAFLDTRAIIILDEPTYGLDRSSFQALGQLLILLKNQGKTIIMVTHDPSLVKICADVELHLDQGRWYENHV